LSEGGGSEAKKVLLSSQKALSLRIDKPEKSKVL